MAKLVIGTDKTVVTPALIKVVEVPAPEKYPLLSRVKDDSNNEIGTVCGYHIDANNQKYAVVCLDAVYRLASGKYMSMTSNIPNLPSYDDARAYCAKETATFNCDKIMDWVNAASGRSSTAVEHCRSKSFVIEGTTYYGQFPTLFEVVNIMGHFEDINTLDATATDNPTLVIKKDTNYKGSSTQYSASYIWNVNYNSYANAEYKSTSLFIIPVLEIPID